jgi:hypothetical protein
VTELGTTAAYFSQSEMILRNDHAWVKQAQVAREDMHAKLSQDRNAQNAAEYRLTLSQLKRHYIVAYIAAHSKARLGVSEEKTRNALRKDKRLVATRALAGITLMPTGQLTQFEEKLAGLKSCSALDEPSLGLNPICQHCSFRPAAEQLDLFPAANQLQQLDQDLDKLLAGWQQTLLDNLEDPVTKESLVLLSPKDQKLIEAFLKAKSLGDPVPPDFVRAVQEALSGLEKITISSADIRQALLTGGAPATDVDLRKRFDLLLNERSKGKDATKLRFVVE